MRTLFAVLASCALLVPSASAQPAQRTDSTRKDPTNTLPLVTTRTARFTTDEGTWMSVDVSPDGSTIVFDLLGDLYTVPMAGGKATRIVGGNSIDMQPRYSPDGKSLVFMSDRSGVDATWIADADGRRPRLLTAGGSYPAWTPDGKQIVTGNRLVDARGGAGIQLQGFGTAASFTGDGRYAWFQASGQAARYDRQTGLVSYRINLPGGVLRPMVSRDGKTLAYFTRYEAQSALVVRDLATGADRWILMGTQPEAGGQVVGPAGGGGRGVGAGPVYSGVGPLPTSAWVPNGSAIVTAFGGKLWRVDVASGKPTQIAFSADVEQSLGPLVKGAFEIGDSIRVREIREPALSPDGRRVAFTGLGKLWVMDLNGGTPRRLTTSTGVVEGSPAWTPDGQAVVYTSWVDGDGGDIHQVDLSGGAPRNLTRAPAMYARLNFTPDGSRLVFARAPRRARTNMLDDATIQLRNPAGGGTELNFELRWMSATGGTQHPITMVADVGALPLGGYPHFARDTSRVFFHDGTGLVSVRWDGSDRKIVLSRATPQTVLSPDGEHVLSRAGRRNQVYLFERPEATDSLVIDPGATAPPVPIRRLSRAGGDFPAWSRDGSKAVWSSGTTLYIYDVVAGDKATTDSLASAANRPAPDSAAGGGRGGGRGGGGGAADSVTRWAPVFEAARHEIRIAAAADKPAGSVVLRGARIISMKDREVIENGDVVVTGNRITAVGARGSVAIPSGARSIDVSGKTIVPGYVDIHAQVAATSQIHRTLVPQYLADLAFGVTTARDPESPTTDVFTYADRIGTADLLGPRIFATGPTMMDSALTVRTMAEGRDFIRPYASTYPANTIRGDLAATRPDRQRFLMVSKELGLTAVATGAPDFRKSLSAILDGYANHQAAYEIFPIQGDVAKLIAESGLTYTPMLLGRVGSRNGIEHILATETPHTDTKVRRFYSHQDLDRLTRARGTWMPADEYPFQDVAAGAARIVAAGGKVGLGSNGRVNGLGMHWEMWLLARGGMPNHDILRAATIFGAEAIGGGSQIGSIEVGKLADLQVLDRNPLTDIKNTNSLRYVMKNGRLYDATTLDQITPVAKKMDKLWWLELESIGEAR